MKKAYRTHVILCFTMLLMLTCSILFCTVAAEDKFYSVSIFDKKYSISKIIEHPGGDIIYLNISIMLKNSGNIRSDNITVQLTDEDNVVVRRNGTIDPGQTKTFLFTDYPVIGRKEHAINISYYPTFDRVKRTSDNQGTDVVLLFQNKDASSTPGFEVHVLILSLLIFMYRARKKQCKKK